MATLLLHHILSSFQTKTNWPTPANVNVLIKHRISAMLTGAQCKQQKSVQHWWTTVMKTLCIDGPPFMLSLTILHDGSQVHRPFWACLDMYVPCTVWCLNVHFSKCLQKTLKSQPKKVYGTRYSQAVTHPSTNLAQCCLTSVIGQELVLSTWYGCRHV